MTRGVALIGCGAIGAKRAASLPDGWSVASVYDPDATRARALASSTGAKVAASASDAVAEPGVALSIVATIHDALVPNAVAALDAGCPVLVEKPGATSASELASLRAAADRAGLPVRVGFNHRFHPSFLKLRELVAARDPGPLLNIRARYGHGGRPGYDREWRADPSRSGGGELLDQGVHLVDLTRAIGGDVDLAFAELRTDYWDMPVEDNAFVALRIRSGGFAWLHASWTEWRNLFSFEVAYRHAKFEITGLGGSYGPERLTLFSMRPELGPPDIESWEWVRGDESWAAELRDVVAQVDGADPSLAVGAGLGDAEAALAVVADAYAT